MPHFARHAAVSSGLLALSVSLSSFACAQSRLLAVSQRDQTFHVYDAATGAEVASLVEDADAGHEVTASPDGKTAYVPIYGNSGVGRAGTDGDHIEVIDVPSAKITGTIAFSHGVRPHNPIYDRHTGMLLVTTEIDKTVSIVDPKTMKVVGSIPTGQEQSHMTVLTPDGKKLYSANVGPGTVSVMDVRARKLLKVIPISATTQRIACTPDGKWVFTADQKTTDLVVIDTSKDEIAKRIPLPAKAYGTRPTADGSKLLITMPKTDTIGVLDVKSMTLGTPIAGVPKGLNEIVVSPDGAWAWASSPLENNISIIDMKTMKVTKTFPSGKFVDGLWLIAKK